MRPNPFISIVCHVLAQSVCTNRNINAPNRKTKFPVAKAAGEQIVNHHVQIYFFLFILSIGGLHVKSLFRNHRPPCEKLIQESQPPMDKINRKNKSGHDGCPDLLFLFILSIGGCDS